MAVDRQGAFRKLPLAACACVIAIAVLLWLMRAPPQSLSAVLHERMLGLHLLLELFAIIIAMLVVLVSWHTFDARREDTANLLVTGFLVVAFCDLLHALTYAGMPDLLTESRTDRAIFFWLMGRSAEVCTLGLIALGLTPRMPRSASLALGVLASAGLAWIGAWHVDWLPPTFEPGIGVTPFKAGFEYVLCGLNLGVAVLMLRRSREQRQPIYGLLAMSSFMMGIGEIAFTAYVAPSDLQNILGHGYKVVAYALLYRATFIGSIRAPYDALRASEERLRESEARLRTLSDNLPQSLVYQIVRELDGREHFVHLSGALERLNGLRVEDVLRDPGLLYGQVLAEDRDRFLEADRRSTERLALFDVTVRLRHSDGRIRRMHLVSMPRRLADGRILWDGIETDVTEREEAEEARRQLADQLREAQKMESIGTLASGIAHDFNNVLGAILGNVSLARDDLARGRADDVLRNLEQVRRAGQRARDLVRQILTFSRRTLPQRRVQPLRPIIEESLGLLRASLPPGVALHTRLSQEPMAAAVDMTQIEQVVLNLATNAWQAILPDGGRIDITLDAVALADAAAASIGIAPGRHAHLRVADDGRGMDEATRLRVFEPFFTTKPVGEGTGLGLSVVHGIVRAHDGGITVESVPGDGTRFDVYLPLATGAQVQVPPPAAPTAQPGQRGGRVMYLDDDEVMSLLASELLERAGYAVRCFRDCEAALGVLAAGPDEIDVLVTDYNMPSRSGLEVAKMALARRPGLPVLLISGAITDALRSQALALGVRSVVEKQNTLEDLVAAVDRALRATPAR